MLHASMQFSEPVTFLEVEVNFRHFAHLVQGSCALLLNNLIQMYNVSQVFSLLGARKEKETLLATAKRRENTSSEPEMAGASPSTRWGLVTKAFSHKSHRSHRNSCFFETRCKL
jgi:hypothetical protein